ncbi:phage terminase large subunit family protein [Yersinia enterocolitica]|uniref:phage terminase large subunit family protein n=1 Tax=Yersinia enterocolitica TaxID=630 RepID=UPI00155A5BC7|nr:phage terminase large subunit family protein [Yersinia enterocolitica]MBX9485828.1 phage terminase large subunit family protein [Yersinia enterocolitica]NQS96711.1 phage terminase large subunit family protein [Yersinia enterocolitica]NQT43388.1 phage terminase large subunit family protein [Yersinia enterocolitica]NQT98812.1 phage terminase large subunit family protein [Yersinia enterocolitica]HDL8115194.1 phage terminase large subunit family protein [Yersinia enterocolitica]
MGGAAWSTAFTGAFRPKSRLTISQWADKYRHIAPGTSPEPGPWRTSRVPYLKEPMDIIGDAETEIVVMMCSSQVGKSELELNVMGYFADQEPSPQLMTYPTVEAAEAFSKERIEPTFKYSPGLKNKLSEGKEGRGNAKKSSTTIRMKHYAGGYLALVGANAPSGLASRPIRIYQGDEIDCYGAILGGDPLKLAIQRTTNFHNRKIILVSTPTKKAISKIFAWWEASDQRRFHVPCSHCGASQILKWSQVKWDKNDLGEALAHTARYECKECGSVMRGAGKPDPDDIARGVWIADKPEVKGVAGFHINSLYSPWVDLFSLVKEFSDAIRKRDKNGLMEFINLKLGEPWEEEIKSDLDHDYLLRRRERYDTDLPQGVLILTAGVDVQDKYLAVEVIGWGKGKESWGIEYRIFMGETKFPAVWNQLDEFLQRCWTLATGQRLFIASACIDSGGHATTETYQFTKPRENRRIYSIRGRGGAGLPFIGKPTNTNRVGAMLFNLGVDDGKGMIIARVNMHDEGPGYMHFPLGDRGYDTEYFKGLLSERKTYKYLNGQVKETWEKIYERNEPFDCRNYGTAALEILNPNFDWLAEQEQLGNIYVQNQQTPSKKKRRIISRGI